MLTKVPCPRYAYWASWLILWLSFAVWWKACHRVTAECLQLMIKFLVWYHVKGDLLCQDSLISKSNQVVTCKQIKLQLVSFFHSCVVSLIVMRLLFADWIYTSFVYTHVLIYQLCPSEGFSTGCVLHGQSKLWTTSSAAVSLSHPFLMAFFCVFCSWG